MAKNGIFWQNFCDFVAFRSHLITLFLWFSLWLCAQWGSLNFLPKNVLQQFLLYFQALGKGCMSVADSMQPLKNDLQNSKFCERQAPCSWQSTVLADWDETLTQEERRFLYFHHLFKNFLEQMIPQKCLEKVHFTT